MVYRLVFENFKHRPVRTLLSAILVGVQVTMILTLVGVSQGMMDDISVRSRGTGADIMIRPPDSSVFSVSGMYLPEKIVSIVRQQPHVTLATGTLVQPQGPIESIAGIRLDEFNALSGGFKYLEGGPFRGPDDLLIDEVEGRSKHIHAGATIDLGRKWHVTGVVQSGKLSRMFADLGALQEDYAATGKVSIIWVKVDDPDNIPAVIESLKARLQNPKIFSMEEFTSLVSADNLPILQRFTYVVIGIAVIGGFLVVFLSMYTAVLERTREIGILKALGASPGYILGILMRETVLLAIVGTIAGILMSYGTKSLMTTFVPTMTTIVVKSWWPWAALIAMTGSLIGAFYPGLKAAKQDAIEALAYD